MLDGRKVLVLRCRHVAIAYEISGDLILSSGSTLSVRSVGGPGWNQHSPRSWSYLIVLIQKHCGMPSVEYLVLKLSLSMVKKKSGKFYLLLHDLGLQGIKRKIACCFGRSEGAGICLCERLQKYLAICMFGNFHVSVGGLIIIKEYEVHISYMCRCLSLRSKKSRSKKEQNQRSLTNFSKAVNKSLNYQKPKNCSVKGGSVKKEFSLPINENRANFEDHPAVKHQFDKFTSPKSVESKHDNDSMAVEFLRVYSMHNYPSTNGPSLLRLAQSGFYYDGNGSELICFSCGFKQSHWKYFDSPLEIHKKMSPYCKFLLGGDGNVPVPRGNHSKGPALNSQSELGRMEAISPNKKVGCAEGHRNCKADQTSADSSWDQASGLPQDSMVMEHLEYAQPSQHPSQNKTVDLMDDRLFDTEKMESLNLEHAPVLDLEEMNNDHLVEEVEPQQLVVQHRDKEDYTDGEPHSPDSGYMSFDIGESVEPESEEEFPRREFENAMNKHIKSEKIVMKPIPEGNTRLEEKMDFKSGSMSLKSNSKKNLEIMLENISYDLFCEKYNKENKYLKSMKNLDLFTENINFPAFVYSIYPAVCYFRHRNSIDFSQGMKVELLRFGSFAHQSLNLYLPFLFLAKEGFYYDQSARKVLCFACNKSYTPEQMEGMIRNHSVKVRKTLHENWCLINDYGNVPVTPPQMISRGLPSTNKRIFIDENGKRIVCHNFCGINTFFTEQELHLRWFPALKDAYVRSDRICCKVILEMLNKGSENSARGMHYILEHTKMLTSTNTTSDDSGTIRINQMDFKLIEFSCCLMKNEIVFQGRCGCEEEIRRLEKEQIVLWNPKSNCPNGVNFFQHVIKESLEIFTVERCKNCKQAISWTLSNPPPCIFLNLFNIKNLTVGQLEPIIFVMDQRYTLGTVYFHCNSHFFAWIRDPSGQWICYDDSNVDRQCPYTAHTDVVRALLTTGNTRLVLASYYISLPIWDQNF